MRFKWSIRTSPSILNYWNSRISNKIFWIILDHTSFEWKESIIVLLSVNVFWKYSRHLSIGRHLISIETPRLGMASIHFKVELYFCTNEKREYSERVQRNLWFLSQYTLEVGILNWSQCGKCLRLSFTYPSIYIAIVWTKMFLFTLQCGIDIDSAVSNI